PQFFGEGAPLANHTLSHTVPTRRSSDLILITHDRDVAAIATLPQVKKVIQKLTRTPNNYRPAPQTAGDERHLQADDL
ncbi:hypothetical protein, partial [Pseudomonas aeruginosa]|uniref:hypothetical protein n=1 Tax=Pseudomonas aeruginosa TaxID=287 RepID=UPI003525A401